MTILTTFSIGFLVYLSLVTISYVKIGNAYLLAALLGAISNICWIHVAKSCNSPNQILKMGLYWDSMITLVYFLLPFLIFNVKINTTTGLLGIILIISGIFTLKIG